MNGLTLRVNPSNKKVKNSIGFPPIMLSCDVNIETKNILFEQFLTSNTADEQLCLIRAILESVREHSDEDVMQFLALVFLQADAKHPVKCFLARQITKNETLQQPFAKKLSKEIERLTVRSFAGYPQYVDVVSRVATCIENFTAGTMAIKLVEIQLAEHLNNCLDCCITTLRQVKLSPTEKNEIYSLSHLALRLLLYIVQKVNEDNTSILLSMFGRMRAFIQHLIFDEDAPMDTRSLCGILFVSMELLENGPDAWLCILESKQTDENISHLLENEAAQLSLYSAIATVVPVLRIQEQRVNNQSAIVYLTEKIIDIGERSSSESIFMLSVARTLLQISKMLQRVSEPVTGSQLMEHVLSFVWGHLEHYMDSVRHLAAQALANVVRYCTGLQKKGDETGLDSLFTALAALDKTRKSYYVSLTSLTAQLGAARVTRRLPGVVRDVIDALHVQAVQASATTALEMLLQKHTHESNTEAVYAAWVLPILGHVATQQLDSSVLHILENLLARAVALDENVFTYMLPHIQLSCSASHQGSLKSVLVLLSAARKSGVVGTAGDHHGGDWKGIIGYDVLRRAAVDAVDEIRILSLSLVAESPKSTEPFAAGDLDFVLFYLRYNVNAQSPNFRQLTLSFMKKFLKRLEDSYKPLLRVCSDSAARYLSFAERLRDQCFGWLAPGANYSRRYVALQLLCWTGDLNLDGYCYEWKKEYVDKLLVHLEDSYENNKVLALRILDRAPSAVLQGKNFRVSLDIEAILREASSMKPTDCVSAAYKLNFIKRKLPDQVLQGNVCTASDPVLYTLVRRLLAEAQRHLTISQRSIVAGARHGPMYGVLHCIGHLMEHVDASAISADSSWRALVHELVTTCVDVNAAVACVVNNDSPEGHLPMDAGGVAVSDHGNTGDVVLEDGRPVTAQMVLLCAWRSVKEVSLLLGTISSRLTVAGEEAAAGTLSHIQMELIGQHFTELLAETKHRGAFEQAYVGFTRLLARLWRCRSAPLHGLPRRWLAQLTGAVAAPKRHPAACATRRSAGLPFMIQALLTTELQVEGNPKCLHECIATLLRLARCNTLDPNNDTGVNNKEPRGDSEELLDSALARESVIETRTHSVNILRALFRNSMLEESLAGYVGEGLMVALQGFEGDTWMERNSSTLLFSALMVRVFGVARDRRAEAPAVRNTMTGRIFFLRYPQLYDFILNKLKEACTHAEERLHPLLCPLLVLLARLHVSALEGAASALRLAALAPLVHSAAAARPHAARRLAARALPPLVTPDRYIPFLKSMFTVLRDRGIKRNYCHGVLLQVARLLDRKPRDLAPGHSRQSQGADHEQILAAVKDTKWILEQARGDRPCYMLADEYVKMVNLIIWRFPSFIDTDMLNQIQACLDDIIFTADIPPIASGREVCLANCIYLYFVILNKLHGANDIPDLIYRGLNHRSYEVVLSTLNYLLILYKDLDVDSCRFQQHLSTLANGNVLAKLEQSAEYIEKLCTILESNKYLECVQKTLKVLTLKGDTQRYIVGVKTGNKGLLSDEEVIRHLFAYIQNEHENLTHIYLRCLSDFVSEKLRDSTISKGTVLHVIRMVFACSCSENSESTRLVVSEFLERNFETLLKFDLDGLTEEDKFEFTSTLWAAMVTVLEDDEPAVRQRAADVIAVTSRGRGGVVPARAAELLREVVGERRDGAALLVLLALMDFKSEVCMTDEISDECRVFDQNERYNIFLEECVWTGACADYLVRLRGRDAKTFALSIVDDPTYRDTFDKLCNNNVILFRQIVGNQTLKSKNEIVNPKIELFISKLC